MLMVVGVKHGVDPGRLLFSNVHHLQYMLFLMSRSSRLAPEQEERERGSLGIYGNLWACPVIDEWSRWRCRSIMDILIILRAFVREQPVSVSAAPSGTNMVDPTILTKSCMTCGNIASRSRVPLPTRMQSCEYRRGLRTLAPNAG